ncbi:hypothetical protein ACKKBG_A38825 [Auxenochlorella protothecoides x Auxenochlorella symbiontica]
MEVPGSLMALQINGVLEDALADSALVGPGLSQYLEALSEHLATATPTHADSRAFMESVQLLLAAMSFVPGNRPFKYQAPILVRAIGPAALECVLLGEGGVLSVDVALKIPASCFDNKDQLNNRYHAKRALYLAEVAARLRRHPSTGSIAWEAGSDPRRPFLALQPAATTGLGGLTLRLHAVPAEGTFPLSKLAPHRNNLRGVVGADGQPAPTPHYNHSILEDLLLLRQTAEVTEEAARNPALRSALALLLVWARAHSLDEGADGLSPGFLVQLLLYTAAKSSLPSALDLVRAALVTLSSSRKLHAGAGLTVPRGAGGARDAALSPSAWRAAHNAVLVDSGGWVNAAAPLSAGALASAGEAARRALRALNAGTPEGFASAFRGCTDLLCTLGDAWVHVDLSEAAGASWDLASSDAAPWRAQEAATRDVARRALGDRARSVRVVARLAASDPARPLPGPAAAAVLVAVRLDPVAARRGVDVGPSAEDVEGSRAFRAFWGDERAELRRFQDGRIAEAVVWTKSGGAKGSDTAPPPRHAIVDAALAHALPRHIPGARVSRASATLLDAALGGEAEEAAAVRGVAAAAERLGKQLRGLTGTVLRVVATQALDPATRGAALHAPRPHPLAGSGVQGDAGAALPRCLRPLPLLCSVEGSGRWPAAPEAFRVAKAALACQLATALAGAHGLHAEARADASIEVLAHGHAFLLHLATDRDAAMREAERAERGAAHQGAEVESAEEDPDQALLVSHQGFVGGLAAEHPAFTPAVRLAKAWVARHLLSNHLGEEAVELLVAAAFVGPMRPMEGTPASRLSGFLSFLHILSEHPWGVAPLAVVALGPGGRLPAACRSPAHPLSLLVLDGEAAVHSPWTAHRPAAPVVRRLGVLARRARAALHAALVRGEAGVDACAAVFSRELHECDALLRLRPDALPAPGGGLEGAEERESPAGSATTRTVLEAECAAFRTRASRAVLSGIPYAVVARRGAAAVRRELLVGFDPVAAFVRRLQARLDPVAVVLADLTPGAGVVGLKWRAPALQAAACPVAAAQEAGEAASGGRDAEARALGALCDALFLGAGLVRRVEVVERVLVVTGGENGANCRTLEEAQGAPIAKRPKTTNGHRD